MANWGIDIGISGAIVYCDIKLGHVEVFDMPTLEVNKKTTVSGHMIANILKKYQANVWIESVSARPMQGVASMFNFGKSYGIVLGVVETLNYPVHLVTPFKWQQKMRVPKGKDGSRQKAMQMLPKFTEQFARKKDHGRSDAALISLYGSLYGDNVE